MFTRYLKSNDERTVVKVSNPKSLPPISEWYTSHGYTEIEQTEFKKLRARIRRLGERRHGYTNDESELQEHLSRIPNKEIPHTGIPETCNHPDCIRLFRS